MLILRFSVFLTEASVTGVNGSYVVKASLLIKLYRI
jgi:hypothetical protein